MCYLEVDAIDACLYCQLCRDDDDYDDDDDDDDDDVHRHALT